MPASVWLERVTGTLETSVLAEAALTGAAITTLPPGIDADPLILEISYFRPARPQSGNLLAHARVINASRFFVFTQVDIEDPEGRQIGHGTSHSRIRSVEPSPPAPPATLPPVEESTYPTPDPYLRPATRGVVPPEVWEENNGLAVVQLIAEGRFPNPYATIMGRELQAVDEGQVVASLPASEWLCLFSRSVAAGPIASMANGVGMAAGLTLLGSGQLLVGLNLSVSFHHPLLPDGRAMRVEASSVRREQDLTISGVNVHDANGTLVASGRVIGASIYSSRRHRRPATDVKRILATLLFTDIVGSTQHAKRLGDARWKALLEQHHSLVRAELRRWEGVEVDTAGDGFFVRFESPGRALECGRAVRSAVAALGLQVRVGIHAGECELHQQRPVGLAVHIAARLQSLAAPGEILVSSTVKDLAAGSAFRFDDRGQHALKGIPDEWSLFALAD